MQIKYTAAEIWLLWWVLLKYLRKFNSKKAVWFCFATNANSEIPRFITHESPKGPVEFQFSATDGDSKTQSFTTDETLYTKSEVIPPPPVHLSSAAIYKVGIHPEKLRVRDYHGATLGYDPQAATPRAEEPRAGW
jgi:hypothetical protein